MTQRERLIKYLKEQIARLEGEEIYGDEGDELVALREENQRLKEELKRLFLTTRDINTANKLRNILGLNEHG